MARQALGLLAVLQCLLTASAAREIIERQQGLVVSSSLPVNWTFTGCYTDQAYSPTLSGATYSNSTSMTQETCVLFCASLGFIHSGVEYSSQCFCGNDDLTNLNASLSDCSMSCSGNSSEACGGGNRLNIFTSNQTATSPVTNPGFGFWALYGCYKEGINGRALTTDMDVPGGGNNMSVANCVNACWAAGFVLSGVEFGGQCFCGNQFSYQSKPAVDGYKGCNDYPCNGNASELCGGQDHLDVYGYNNTVPNPLLTTSSSSTVSSTTTSLSSQATNNVQATSVSSPSSNSQPATSLTPTNSLSTASATSTAASWSYIGCWVDAVGSRSLGNQITGKANIMTTELCMSECASAGYTLAGLEYYSECYCDTQVRNGGALATDPTTCNTACNGNSSETCGGGNRLSIFRFGTSSGSSSSSSSSSVLATTPSSSVKAATGTSSSSSSAVSASSTAPSWNLLGCYTDSVGARTLGNAINGYGNVMTNELCQSSCKSAGYTLAGTEYSGECYCDSSLRNGGGPASDGNTGCSMICNGNTTEICGGSNRLSMYSFVVPSSNSQSTQSTTSSSSSAGSSSSSSSAAVATPTSGWTSLGCYNDSVGSRTLNNPQYGNNNAMTVELCQSTCMAAGFILSGVEYGGECYCDNSFQNYGAPATDGCTMACHGSSTEICGGSNRLNVYKYAVVAGSSLSSISSTVSKSQSFTSSTSASVPNTSSTLKSTSVSSVTSPSALNTGVKTSSSLSSTKTSSSSSTKTTSFSVNTTSSSVSSIKTTSSSLKMTSVSSPTKPTSSQSSVKKTISSSSSSSSTTKTTSNTSKSASTASGVQSSSTTSSSSTLTQSTSTQSTSSSGTSSQSLSTAKTTSSQSLSTSTTTFSSATASSTTAIGWYSLGCYVDSVQARTLGNGMQVSGGANSMTNEACTAVCQSNGYTLAGTEYSGECYCDTAFRNGGGPASDGSTGCNMVCNGNSSEICGGSNRLSMFQYYSGVATTTTSSSLSSTLSSSATTTSSAATGLPLGWKYDGCYVDNANGRIMMYQQNDNSQLTVESCVQTCSGLGYTVAGMEYAQQCFCDDYIRNGAALSSSDSDCGMSCAGNNMEKCGAGNRVSIYSLGNVTVYQPPTVQNTSLPGNWSYVGCLTDNADSRTFPYRIVNMINNNTATNCLSLCSQFGYPAGGMEYSSECYCGDFSNIVNAGATMAPATDCDMACSGDPNSICGGGSRISYYAWTGTPLYSWSRPTGITAGEYQFLIGGVVIPLVTSQTIKGKVTFLEKFGTGAPNTTGAYELDLAEINNFTAAWRPMHVKTDVFCSASLTLPDKSGRQINVGGWANDATYGIRLYSPDGSPGVAGVNDWQENVNEVSLQNGRWYPSAMIMANGSILVVGGEEGSNGAPVPTLELLPPSGGVLYCDWLDRTDPYNLYPFLAVLPSGGIFVAYYNEARILDEGTLQTSRILPNMPGAVNDFLAGRTYPFEGTSVIMPQHAPYSDPLTIMVCGGSTPGPEIALDNCVSIQPEVAGANWTIERMPSQRVISCMTALPDGTYLILNGGQQGRAGFGLATNPNLNAVLYDPSQPVNNRMSVMANTTIDRLYHSEAILLQDGRVLVSGSDPEDTRFPQEYRVEVFVPPYLLSGNARPTFNVTHTDWAYGQSVTITVTSGNTANMRASLLGAEASTHGNSMGQRTIFPAFSCSGNTCTITAPPNSHVCPPGWFQLFLLDGSTPSISTYVRIGGDPGNLGNWPNFSDFYPLPGV